MGEPGIGSPRIQQLASDLAINGASALDGFWREIDASGAPLIEPIDGDAEHLLITFLYRGDDTTNEVAAIGWIAGSAGLQPLAKLAETNV